MKNIANIIAPISIIICIFLWVKISDLQADISAAKTETSATAAETELELAVYMGRLQLYANKLYFAGINENESLYKFYLHEMEEAMETIADGKVVSDNGIDISANMKAFGEQSLQVLEKKIEEEGFKNFKSHYNNLISSCNSCHKVSQKGMIVITEPKKPVFDNQDYSKKEALSTDVDGD